ncbi:MAG: hypothetical protein ACR5LD_08290 [Symbiopectobacterium sp.]
MSELITQNLLSADANGDPAQLRYIGAHRLLVVSGEAHWVCKDRRKCCADRRRGIGFGCGIQSDSIPFSKARMLLEQEYQHAVFDARNGLDIEVLAIVAGTLRVRQF